MSKKTILCLAGSTRKASLNKQLARQAADIATAAGANGQFVDLADYEMPLYNGDYEAANSLPESAKALKALITDADGLFIASPEYNGSFSPVLKNTIDWVSRRHLENEAGLSAYQGKIAGIGSASSGLLGGLRGLVPLRMLLGNIGVTVVPKQMAVGGAHGKMTEGVYTDEATLEGIEATIHSMLSLMP